MLLTLLIVKLQLCPSTLSNAHLGTRCFFGKNYESKEIVIMAFNKKIIASMVLAITISNQASAVIDLASIAAVAAVNAMVSGVIAGAFWLISPSKDDRDYEERHKFFMYQSKDFFVKSIREAKERGELEGVLQQHELYRYENFLAALEAECPTEFAVYLKKLEVELDADYKKRDVRGFVITRHGIILVRSMRSPKEKDTFQFYELIKSLVADVDIDQASQLETVGESAVSVNPVA